MNIRKHWGEENDPEQDDAYRKIVAALNHPRRPRRAFPLRDAANMQMRSPGCAATGFPGATRQSDTS